MLKTKGRVCKLHAPALVCPNRPWIVAVVGICKELHAQADLPELACARDSYHSPVRIREPREPAGNHYEEEQQHRDDGDRRKRLDARNPGVVSFSVHGMARRTTGRS